MHVFGFLTVPFFAADAYTQACRFGTHGFERKVDLGCIGAPGFDRASEPVHVLAEDVEMQVGHLCDRGRPEVSRRTG